MKSNQSSLKIISIHVNLIEKLQKKHQSFLAELQTIEKEIRDVSHKLSNNIESSQLNFSTIIHNLLKGKSKIGNFKFEYELDPSIHWRDVNELIKVIY